MEDEGKSTKACDACRRRKLRCRQNTTISSSESRCVRCVQTNLKCTYNDERRKRGPKTGRRLREIRECQASPAGEASSLSSPLRTSQLGVQSPDTHNPQTGGTRDRGVSPSQFMELSSFDLTRDQTDDDLIPNDGDETVSIAQDVPIDQLLYLAPNAAPFDFGPTPSTIAGSTMVNEPVHGHRRYDLVLSDSAIRLSREQIIDEIGQLFANVYQRYPLWHLDRLLNRLENQEHTTESSFHLVCLSIFLLNECIAFRKDPCHGKSRLTRLVDEIESRRPRTGLSGGHFAELPSVDASVVSLTLFVAHSICDRHSIAFYYLNEAAGLLRLVDPDMLDSIDAAFYRRVEAVLFVTESASLMIYGKSRKHRLIPCPENLSDLQSSMRWYDKDYHSTSALPTRLSEMDLVPLDHKAVNFLCVLVFLYSATNAEEISKIPICSPAMSEFVRPGTTASTSMQAADVDITRQWQLALHLQQALSPGSTNTPTRRIPGAKYTLQVMGFTALQYSTSMSREEYRVIGHGKLASLATTIFDVASTLDIVGACSSVIGELIRTVYTMDYERHFAPDLSMVQMCIEEVPRQITLPEQDVAGLLDLDSVEDVEGV